MEERKCNHCGRISDDYVILVDRVLCRECWECIKIQWHVTALESERDEVIESLNETTDKIAELKAENVQLSEVIGEIPAGTECIAEKGKNFRPCKYCVDRRINMLESEYDCIMFNVVDTELQRCSNCIATFGLNE